MDGCFDPSVHFSDHCRSSPTVLDSSVEKEMELTATRMMGNGGGAADYMFWWEQQGEYMERRQHFLRSYHFSRKQAPRERARRMLVRARRLVWARLRDARRLPRILWAKVRSALSGVPVRRRRHFHRLAAFQKLTCRRNASRGAQLVTVQSRHLYRTSLMGTQK